MKKTRFFACMLIFFIPVVIWPFNQELQGADSLKVGTPFLFKITADYAIESVSIPDTLEDFAILESRPDGKNPRSWQIKLAPLKTGALSFPRIVVKPVDSSVTPVYTDGFRVYVLSVLAEGDTLLRDIKPLQKYPLQLGIWVYLILLLIAIALAVYLWLKRPKKPKREYLTPPEPKQAVLPAWKTALQALNKLIEEDLPAKGEVVIYHFRLSNILRAFLEETYHFPALEMTGNEIITFLYKRNIPNFQDIRAFINYCDMVKFAKREPSIKEIENYTLWLKDYLISFIGNPVEAESD